MTLTEFYAAVGGSYEDASARLQNDAFIGRFLRMLPRDDNMARLTAAVDSGSAEEAPPRASRRLSPLWWAASAPCPALWWAHCSSAWWRVWQKPSDWQISAMLSRLHC